ncbi:MAG: hypothetical protein PHX10_12785 [Gallionellaceae bacterium]|nr:hypothetical protein [Gallionellaceae bacterium]
MSKEIVKQFLETSKGYFQAHLNAPDQTRSEPMEKIDEDQTQAA